MPTDHNENERLAGLQWSALARMQSALDRQRGCRLSLDMLRALSVSHVGELMGEAVSNLSTVKDHPHA